MFILPSPSISMTLLGVNGLPSVLTLNVVSVVCIQEACLHHDVLYHTCVQVQHGCVTTTAL